jgi:hypothetical protein
MGRLASPGAAFLFPLNPEISLGGIMRRRRIQAEDILFLLVAVAQAATMDAEDRRFRVMAAPLALKGRTRPTKRELELVEGALRK